MKTLSLDLVAENCSESGARKQTIPVRLEKIVLEAARIVWFAQQVGTKLPFLVVEGHIWIEENPSEFVVKERECGEKITHGGGVAMDLVAKEAGYGTPGGGELCGPDEVACFAGGAPQWRETVRGNRIKSPDGFTEWSDWEILKYMLTEEDEYDCDSIAATIRTNLLRDGWIKRIEMCQPPDGETLLRELVLRRDTVPAAMLLHSVLHELARSPMESAQKILGLCDFVGRSPDHEKYKVAAVGGMQALSKAVNKQRFSRASMAVHQLLRQRGNQQCFPGFIHQAKPRAAAEFI